MGLLRGDSRFYLCPSEWDGQGTPEFKKTSVQDALAEGFRAYASPHVFGDDNRIMAYGGVVVLTDVDWSAQADAWGKYGVFPTEILPVDGDARRKWLVFRFDRLVSERKAFERYACAAAWAYAGTDVAAFPADKEACETGSSPATTEKWEDLSSAYRLSGNDSVARLNLTSDSSALVDKCNALPVGEVAAAAEGPDRTVDPVRNFVCWPAHFSGAPFFHVLRLKAGRVRETMEFFREKYGINFPVTKDDFESERAQGGFFVDQGTTFMPAKEGYVGINQSNGKEFRLSDFHIRALYKVCGDDGKVENWVKLVNPTSGYSSPEIELPGESGKTAFTNFLLKFKLSFFGEAAHIVDIHRHVTMAPVPVVKRMTGLGFKGDLLFLGNGVYDMVRKELCRRTGKFWFSPSGDGYLCLTQSGGSVEDMRTLPKFPEGDGVTGVQKVVEEFLAMYGGTTGRRAVAWMFGAMGYGRFQPKAQYPMLLVHGVKGSGKTELHKLLYRAYGFSNAFGFDPTTLFAMRTLFSHFDRIPVFMSEYRRNIPYHEQKTEILRCAYDRSGFSHGTADLRLVSYSFDAIPAIEGEEQVSDPAVRSRAFHAFLSRREQVDGFDAKVKSPTFDWALMSYLAAVSCDKDRYVSWIEEGRTFCPKAEARIRDNAGSVFAGCMAVAPEMREFWKETVMGMATEVSRDMEESSGVREFVRKISMHAGSLEGAVLVHRDVAYFDVGMLVEGFKKLRVRMNLDVETYVGYAQQAGYDVGYCDLGDRTIFAMKVPIVKDMDPAFKTLTNVYAEHKKRFG